MNDRELLELAAKAAGREFHWIAVAGGHLMQASEPGSRSEESWNPLTHDGDALRLAVKLSIGTCFSDGVVTSMIMGLRRGTETPVLGAPVPLAGDPCAATRRAIVRAAAEIGRQMDAPQSSA
jgi:hypothetical protein